MSLQSTLLWSHPARASSRGRWALLGALAFAHMAGAAAPVGALPTFPFEGELPQPTPWRYARYQNFEVLSQHSDSVTRAQIRGVAAVQAMVDTVTGFELRYSLPCLLMFHQDKARYLELLPVADEELAERTARPTAVNGRKFLRGTEQTALVHFGDLYHNPYAAGAKIIHNIFQQNQPRPPVWFRVGVGNLIRVTDPDLEWDPKRFYALTLSFLPPMPDLLNAPLPPSDALTINLGPEATASPLARFHHHAALFVHWGLFSEDARHRGQMMEYVRRAAEGPVNEEDFRECFGTTFAEMNRTLRDYMGSPAFRAVQLPAERKRQLAALRPIELREATPAEAARINGDARVMAGYGADARREYLAAYSRGHHDPALLGALGVLESNGENRHLVRPLLEAAAAARVPRPSVYLALARLRYPEIKAAAGGGRPTRADAAAVLGLLQQARALKPPVPEVYQCLVVLLGEISDPLSPDELAVADEAARLFPRDAELIFAGAKLKRDHRDHSGAARLVEAGLRASANDRTRARFEKLKSTLVASAEGAR